TDAYQSRAATMQIPAELLVQGDEGRIRQILVNLLTNALKYSAPGTPITITAGALEHRQRFRPLHPMPYGRRMHATPAVDAAGMVQVSVQDQGLGIPPRDAGKLFNRFVRLERDIAGPVRGTGVGLYLCRVLVEAMGGRIWVESTGVPGEG